MQCVAGYSFWTENFKVGLSCLVSVSDHLRPRFNVCLQTLRSLMVPWWPFIISMGLILCKLLTQLLMTYSRKCMTKEPADNRGRIASGNCRAQDKLYSMGADFIQPHTWVIKQTLSKPVHRADKLCTQWIKNSIALIACLQRPMNNTMIYYTHNKKATM